MSPQVRPQDRLDAATTVGHGVRMPGPKRDCQCVKARHEHGTNRAYCADACRCQPCRDAHNRYSSKRRRLTAYGQWDRWTTPDGTVRRVRALHALGWSMVAVAELSDLDPTRVRRIARGLNGERLRRDIADRVAAAYDDLSSRLPVGNAHSISRARNFAKAQGWLPPIWWDDDTIDAPDHADIPNESVYDDIDEIAVDEAIAGRNVALTRAELSDAVQKMTGMGYSADEIADRLGTSSRNVQRHRAEVAA